MAIPDDPLFTQSRLDQLNAGLRALALSSDATGEMASYLRVNAGTVAEWCYVNDTIIEEVEQEVERTRTVRVLNTIKWEDAGYTRDDMLDIIEDSRRNFTVSKIKAVLRSDYGIIIPKNYTKADIIAYMRRGRSDWKKSALGDFMDRIQPRTVAELEEETFVEVQTVRRRRRLPDALDPEIYLGKLLSFFSRGTQARMRADLVLALNGEVTQTPQAGEREATFLRRATSLYKAEEFTLWPLRLGHSSTFNWPDPFTAEMWFRATLMPGPDVGVRGTDVALTRWFIQVEYYQIYEAVELFHSSGWPRRLAPKTTRARTEEEKEAKIREKEGYAAWRRERARKSRQKRKANR